MAGVLEDAGVNVQALSIVESTDTSLVRLVLEPTAGAREALKEADYSVTETQVIAVHAADVPGMIGRMADRIARSGMNITYTYGSAATSGEALLIFGVDNVTKGDEILRKAASED